MDRLPKWADVALVPLVSLALAALISALVILAIGQDPIEALNVMVTGALGSAYGWGYTLYYATNFMFTGLAVSIAFQASLFNIGGRFFWASSSDWCWRSFWRSCGSTPSRYRRW